MKNRSELPVYLWLAVAASVLVACQPTLSSPPDSTISPRRKWFHKGYWSGKSGRHLATASYRLTNSASSMAPRRTGRSVSTQRSVLHRRPRNTPIQTAFRYQAAGARRDGRSLQHRHLDHPRGTLDALCRGHQRSARLAAARRVQRSARERGPVRRGRRKPASEGT